ncbi:MAG: putative glycoside hydrolase [Actinomycetota bacterium]
MRPRPRLDLGVALIVVAALGLITWMGSSFWSATRVDVELAGLVDGTPFTPDDARSLDVAIVVPSEDDRFRAHVAVDGVEVLEDLGGFVDDTLHIRPVELVESGLVEGALDEGDHLIELRVGRLFLSDSVFRWHYAVDSKPPTLELPSVLEPVAIDSPVAVTGRVEEGVEVRLGGEPIETDGDVFEVSFERPPTGILRFEAIDGAGNRTVVETRVPIVYPEASHGVHVTSAAWSDPERRAALLDLITSGLIDTVELDLKDESGRLGYASDLAVAKQMGAVTSDVDLRDAVGLIEERGARVIGRIVAFRDPTYVAAAWAAGRKDEVIQSPDGEPLSTGGGYANYVHADVRQYNLDIALEAAELGVRDILWDYARRPEGSPPTMVVPGLDGPSSVVVAGFLEDAHEQLRRRGVFQGATVLGIAAASGDAVAQDVPAMARGVDYLAPTLFPADWGPGQYKVASPIREPGEMVTRALAHFKQVTDGSGVRFLPWLQDFSVRGVTYGPAEVRGQIDAAAALGIPGFLLWNPSSRYTAEALTPIP